MPKETLAHEELAFSLFSDSEVFLCNSSHFLLCLLRSSEHEDALSQVWSSGKVSALLGSDVYTETQTMKKV